MGPGGRRCLQDGATGSADRLAVLMGLAGGISREMSPHVSSEMTASPRNPQRVSRGRIHIPKTVSKVRDPPNTLVISSLR